MTRWRCVVCFYGVQGENPPDECPRCGVKGTAFGLIQSPKVWILPEEFFTHLRTARREILLAVRSLIDRRISSLERAREAPQRVKISESRRRGRRQSEPQRVEA